MVRVIFTGTTGVRKAVAIDKLLRRALAEGGRPTHPDDINARKFVRYFDFEKLLERKAGMPFWAFLTSLNDRDQRNYWSSTFEDILAEISKENPHHVFISLHATFFRNSRFFSMVDQTKIHLFAPNLFVTLIDDTYAVYQRINTKTAEKVDPGRTYLRLRDIIAWRTVETLVADLIAKSLGLRSYILAVKHPLNTLFKLVFKPETPIVYASFPISVTRGSRKDQEEINSFRQKLHEEFITFDPLTIDEKIMQFALKKSASIANGQRWSFPKGFSMVDESDLKFPLKMLKSEIAEIDKDIDENVRVRDIRMVSDVDAIVPYRPYFGKVVHEGVKSEIDFASNVGIPRYMYFPKEDGEKDASPFKAEGVVYRSLDGLYEALSKIKSYQDRTWGGL